MKPTYKKVNDFFKRHRSPVIRGGHTVDEAAIYDYLYSLFMADQFPSDVIEKSYVPPTIQAKIGGVEYQYVRVDDDDLSEVQE